MKRIALATTLLLASVLGAQAEIDTWHNTQKRPRSDAALEADAGYCTQTVGPNRRNTPTPPQFKRCMLSRGWRYVRTTRTQADDDSDNVIWQPGWGPLAETSRRPAGQVEPS